VGILTPSEVGNFPPPLTIFGFSKVRYRGIAKNAHRLVVNFALANLYLHRRRRALQWA
jgi:hypothetical protein